MIPEVEDETACDTLNEVEAEAVFYVVTDTIADKKPKKLSER